MLTSNPTSTFARYSKVLSTVIGLNARIITKVPKRDIAIWMRDKIEDLGPTYIKIGQFVSSRTDIFGSEVTDAFASLRDNIKPMSPTESVVALQPLLESDEFKTIDITPFASASIGQVHHATLKDNTRAIIKIKRKDIDLQVKHDVEFLIGILNVLKFIHFENIQDTIDLVKDFEKTVMEEIDFEREINNIKLFSRVYKQRPNVIIPSVYSKLCNSSTIVMEYVESEDLSKFKGDRKELAYRTMDTFIRQLIDDGIVHGDPHSGNIGVNKTGALVLYDFGNIIKLNQQERHILKEIIYYLLVGNKSGIITAVQTLGIKVLDEALLYKYIDLYIEYLKTIDISQFAIIQQGPQVKLPLKLTEKVFKLIRVYGILEGTCKELDPKFNYFDLLPSYMTDIFFDEDFILYKASSDLQSLMKPQIQKQIVINKQEQSIQLPFVLYFVLICNIILVFANIIQKL